MTIVTLVTIITLTVVKYQINENENLSIVMISTIMTTVMIGKTINYQWYYHLKPLLSFPGEVDWVSSIGKAGVFILFYIRHLMRVEVFIPRCLWSRWQWAKVMVRFSFLPSTGDAGTGAEQNVVPEQPLRQQFDQTWPAKQATGKQTNKTLEFHSRK